MTGFIHSIESFGTVDGPGIRLVVFMQGCPMRCLYCHNPDTWELSGGTEMSVDDIIKQYEASQSFYTNGGITVTGGEPLLQIDFVTELFEAARKKGIHTCLDTAGITFIRQNKELLNQFNRILASTSLVMLDLKQINPEDHKTLTGHSNDRILDFAAYLNEWKIPTWIRHVVVPGLTDNAAALYQLGRFIGKLACVRALDVLPYHDMGKGKYEQLGMEYPLKDVPAMTKEGALAAKRVILKGIRDQRAEN